MSIKQTFFSNYGKKWVEKLRTSQLVHSYNKLFNISNTGHLLANLITKRNFGAKQPGISGLEIKKKFSRHLATRNKKLVANSHILVAKHN